MCLFEAACWVTQMWSAARACVLAAAARADITVRHSLQPTSAYELQDNGCLLLCLDHKTQVVYAVGQGKHGASVSSLQHGLAAQYTQAMFLCAPGSGALCLSCPFPIA